MTKRAKILWLDLEMTGLDAENDVILEVAAIATDWDFNELGVFEGIVRNNETELQKRLHANREFWDKNLESKNALLAQNDAGESKQAVERRLLEFLQGHFSSDLPVLLGGNSIHMDRRFIVAQLPALDKKLHYRMLDVSAWKVVFEGKYKKRFPKPEDHRALEDIRGSIMELKYYLSKVKKS